MKKSFVQAVLEECGSPEKAISRLVAETNIQPVDARLNLQVLLNTLGREEESFAVSKQLLEIAPQDHRVLFNHGWHLLKRGELQRGMALLEFGRPLNTYGNPPIRSARPLWSPETGNGHHLLFVLEGGFGDQIIHARFIRDLAQKHRCKVIVITDPGLAPVISRVTGVSAVAQREAALGIYHDSWLPGMSAALALGYEYKDISNDPYLSAEPNRLLEWKEKIDTLSAKKRLKIGIRWAGNPQFEHQQYRLFPESILTSLHDIDGVQLFSFQRDNNLVELPSGIIDLAPELRDWEDTTAALAQMDLVISSCTSVAHMSAALGVPTWVIVPSLPYFTWATPGDQSPWYSSVSLIRQSRFGDWEDVRKAVRKKLVDYSGGYNGRELVP